MAHNDRHNPIHPVETQTRNMDKAKALPSSYVEIGQTLGCGLDQLSRENLLFFEAEPQCGS
jgi:hypothetical protein